MPPVFWSYVKCWGGVENKISSKAMPEYYFANGNLFVFTL